MAVGYKKPYHSNMPNKEYWELRAKENLAECFGETAKVERYLKELYKSNLEYFIKEYKELMRPYIIEDEEIDFSKLNKAMTYDKKFQRKFARLNKEIASFAQALNEESQSRLLESLITAFEFNYNTIALQLGYDIARLDKKAVEAAVRTPFTKDGREFSERVWENISSMDNELRFCLANSIAKGQSIQKTTKEFVKIFGNTTYNSQRIIRTETMAVYAKSSVESYKQLGIEELEILAERASCKICASWDGTRIAVKDAEVGVNIPPAHPNCKCCVKPVVKWRD